MLDMLFRELGTDIAPQAVETIEAGARPRRFSHKETIYLQGEQPDGVYVVAHGCVMLEWEAPNGFLVGFRVAGSGESFGLRSYCGDEPRSTIARTVTDTLTYFLPDAVLTRAGTLDPRLYRGFARILARDIGPQTSKIARNGRMPVSVRLAYVLLNLRQRLQGRTVDGGEHVYFPLTQKDLANLLDVSQETISRTMRDFENDGIISIEHGPRRLVIPPGGRLEEMVRPHT